MEKFFSRFIQLLEYLFSLLLLITVVISLYASIHQFLFADWRLNQTFYDLIYRVLLLVIGLELARLLITHSLTAVIELIAFVIARKTLKPDIDSMDIILIVSSFLLLVIARFIMQYQKKEAILKSNGTKKGK